ncbi:MAG: AraC family transcriptional regulator [Chloroflexi bacterium]|nr:AraC family transcriptional regulator [Chloroflexota bacterium]MDL1882698.1 helix-turn-helix transcriptional regulator [Anaerolineae bacterium CFX8]
MAVYRAGRAEARRGECSSSALEGAIITAVAAFCRERPSVRLNPHQQVHLARLLLDQSHRTPITIEDLSRAVALSPYYLIRVFRQTYKQTPHQYLVGQRIASAKELLRNSDLSITEICAAVGYESLGSFSTSKLFSRITAATSWCFRRTSPAIRRSCTQRWG